MPQSSVVPSSQKSNVNAQVDARLRHYLRVVAVSLAGLTTAGALISISGWLLLKDSFLYPGGSAIVFLLWSTAFFIFFKNKTGLLKLVANCASAVIALVAVLNIANSCFDLDLGLTHPFVALGDSPLNFPGPLLADSSFSFLILSIATALMQLQAKKQESFHKFAALLLLIPNAVIVGSSIVGLQSICTFFGCIKPSLAASLSFIFAGLGMIFAYPDRGITEHFTHNTLGGRLMRCIFLALLPCIPVMALLNYGQIHGLYDQSIANGLMFLTLIAFFICGIAWGARNVEVVEAEKTVALQLLQDSIDSFVPSSDSSYKLVCLECGKEFNDATLAHCPDDGSQLGKLADKLKIGSVFADSYEIVSYIGSGGCSLIYEAKHMLMNKQVALKLLRANFSTETKYVQRFQRESRATSKLVHSNIVVVHDFGISLAGQPYIVMDFLKGMSLESRIDLAGALHWKQAVPIFIDICEGLVYAHKNGVLHRDLKPANIMLVDEGYGQPFVVKIVDFGLAKIIDNTDMQLTQTGELLGSPTYMSPEQCKADPVDHRSDIYSLGALIYHTLSGQPAVQTGNVYEALRMQIEELPAPFPEGLDIPFWLSNLVFRALQKDPEHRQQTMTEILSELKSRELTVHEKIKYS